MGVIIFNDISSKDVGIEVETFPPYVAPERVYQVISVPGRNGDIVIDSGNYKNITRPYQVSIATHDRSSYTNTMNRVAEWLHSGTGYCKLVDSYEPIFYRLAYYRESCSISNLFNEAGKATINFVCKPQRFYQAGDEPILYSSTGKKINNPTGFTALPIINVTKTNAYGTVAIGTHEFAISANSGTKITIDCELQDAYYGTANKNSYIILNDGNFPKIEPGEHIIGFTGGVRSVEVIPRWWTV